VTRRELRFQRRLAPRGRSIWLDAKATIDDRAKGRLIGVSGKTVEMIEQCRAEPCPSEITWQTLVGKEDWLGVAKAEIKAKGLS
jgi:hypothetical protein